MRMTAKVGVFPLLLSALLVLSILAGPARAQDFQVPGGDPQGFSLPGGGGGELEAKAYLDRTLVHPGETFRVALVLSIAQGWHIYGNPTGPGTGKPTEVSALPPKGFHVGPPLYSPPKKLAQPELGPKDWVWGYEKEARIYFRVRAAKDLKPGRYTLTFVVDALACKQSCVPQNLQVQVEVPVGEPGRPSREANGEIFAAMAQARPAGRDAPGSSGGGPDSLQEGENSKAGAGRASPADLERFQREIEKFRPRESGGITSLWWALLLGFLAGVILNVMPCVLPVISIKILSFVQQAKEDRARVFKLGLAFAGGILFVFLILAGLAAFAGQSWGEQFQSSAFLKAMIALVFLFALGMFDLYEFTVPGFVTQTGAETKEGYLGAFAKGMLATVLATPCSGPFLGGTLAWALKQPPLVIFTIFASIGLGMAFPYVVLTAHPAFLKIVPKPGAWMNRFKEFMGFVLMGTVVYLMTILPSNQVVWVVCFCLFLAMGAWIFGKVTGPWKPKGHRLFWRTVALLVIAGGGWLSFGVLQPLYSQEAERGGWRPFEMGAFLKALEEGRNVVVDWTADWCPNCKFVEKTVLESEPVRKAFRRKKVLLMKADITRKRPLAEALLHRLGSRSIPFLGIFPGNDPYRPWILRDIYTKGALLEILERLPASAGGRGGKDSSPR